MTRRPMMALALLMVAVPACKKKPDVEIPECGEDAVVLGEAGEFHHQTLTVDLDWNGSAGVSTSDVVAIAVPDDTTSLEVVVDLAGEATGVGLFQVNDTVWIDATRNDGSDGAWDSEPYYHWGVEGGTVTMPITPETAVEPGCLRVSAATLSDASGEQAILHLLSRRYQPEEPTLDLNVVVVGDTELFQEDLDEALARMDEVWTSAGGPSVGEVTLYTVSGDAYPRYSDSNDIRLSLTDGSAQAVNLFFIQDYADESGTLGEAGGIPGPVGVFGVDASGVIVAIDGHTLFNGNVDTQTMGETMAHEVGHQLGLYHTTESDGTRWESLADTPDCPSSADDGDGYFTAEECAQFDGANFMFWTAGDLAQGDVSDSQALVLRDSVVVR